jgi:hypothetical protein
MLGVKTADPEDAGASHHPEPLAVLPLGIDEA